MTFYGPVHSSTRVLADRLEVRYDDVLMVAHLLLRRITQTITDLTNKPWPQLRILDLGSLERVFALEFASHGAQVVAIEGREINNEKALTRAQYL